MITPTNIPERIMQERARLINNADNAFLKRMEELLCDPQHSKKKKPKSQNKYTGTIILTALTGALFVLLITLLIHATNNSVNGMSAREYTYLTGNNELKSSTPIHNITTIITTMNNTIIKQLIPVANRTCIKFETQRGTTYACEN